jgi:phage terminase large subunit-like protein
VAVLKRPRPLITFDAVIAETNQGGDMVEAVLREVDSTLPVTAVKATRGKWLRAEPVAVAYRQGRVSHVGHWSALEDEMCAFTAQGRANGASPDRLDALVWALTALMQSPQHRPRIRSL